MAEGVAHRVEKRVAGPGDPGAVAGTIGFGRNGPIGLETAEMVNAYDIHEFDRGRQAVNPPAVLIGRMCVPGIQRVAPKLPGLAEIIGWHACNMARSAVAVDLKYLGMGPGIGTVQCDVNRHVAEQAHTVFMGVVSQLLPLMMEQELNDLDVCDVAAGGRFDISQRFPVPMHILGFPVWPGYFTVLVLEDAKQRVVMQPAFVMPVDKVIAGGLQ